MQTYRLTVENNCSSNITEFVFVSKSFEKVYFISSV